MLLQSLLEPTPAQRQRRRWATLASFLAEVAAVAALVILPLVYTEALPDLRAAMIEIPLPPPPGRAAPPHSHSVLRHRTEVEAPLGIHVPAKIPHGVHNAPEPQQLAADPFPLNAVEGSTGAGAPAGVWNSILSASPPSLPPPPRPKPPLPVSQGVTEGLRIREIAPVYPKLAQVAGIQGEVQLSAVIGRDGQIERLQVLSGHPMLVRAALEAVRQWRYRPYYLNGEPVEVATQITVKFVLAR